MSENNGIHGGDEVLDSASVKFIKEYHVNPLEKRVSELEKRLSAESLIVLFKRIFQEQLGQDIFRNRFNNLFNEALKIENFINKVSSITQREMKSEKMNNFFKIGTYLISGSILAIIGGLAQKFLDII